jgi:hypothetical protein
VNGLATYRRLNAKTTIAWGALFYLLSQLALNVYVDGWHPEQYDAEFAARLALLEARIAENPDAPLLLLVGSSRMTMNYLPEQLPPLYASDGRRALPFNFAHMGAGPGMNLLEVRRLLARGIRPDWLVVEIMPPQLNDSRQRILHDVAAARELPLVIRHTNPVVALGIYARSRLSPCYKQRAYLMQRALPGWRSPEDKLESETVVLGPLGGDYAWNAVPHPDAKQVHDRTLATQQGYVPPLQGDFKITDLSDGAMRELLQLCQRERIAVVLLLSPEGPTFQSWYCPNARRLVDDYSARLAAEHDLPLIDARNWLDEGDFVDSHHTTLEGAHRFTQRLGDDLLLPLVAGKLRQDSSGRRPGSDPTCCP